MSSLPTAYTPLESLLLFQALRSDAEALRNTTAISFHRISDQLNAVPLVRNDPTYDHGRLSPDALRELYLSLLKDEVKRDLETQQLDNDTNHATNGHVSPTSRKRKAPSPSLPTVHEAAQHSHLIPQLVTRLYARYRENAERQLRDYERKYNVISRDVSEIEAGEWDERLQKRRTTSATQSPKPSTSAHTQPVGDAQPTKSGTASPVLSQKPQDATVQIPAKRYSQAKIDAVINHGPEPESPGLHRRNSSNTTLPPLSEMAPQSPRFGIPPNIPGPVAPQMLPHMQQPGYNHSPPASQQSPYAPHHAHPMPTPPMQNPMSRPSSSPRPILPPPPGMKLPPPSPAQHAASPGLRGPPLPQQQQQHYQPPHHSSMVPSPTNQTPPQGYAPMQPYYQPQTYQDRRPSYPPPHAGPRQYSTQPPHAGGYQLQPFYMDIEPNKSMPKQRIPQQQTPRPQQLPAQAQRAPAYAQYPATGPRPHVQPDSRLKGIVAALATPPRPLRRPVWKNERRPPPADMHELPQPDVEPLSPVLGRATAAARPTRSARKRDPEPVEDSSEQEPAPPPRKAGKRRAARHQTPQSVVSSATEDLTRTRTRSQSVTNVLPDDQPGSKGNSIKNEPSTPADGLDTPDALPEPAATPASGPMTRKRRGTLQSHPIPPSKRSKRQDSPPPAAPDAADEEPTDTTPPPPPPRPTTTTVLARRNFAKMAATIMNDITSHKHASYFAHPVRDRDASGYSDIIKHPTNLKAIRAAITAGTRAVAAATTTSNIDSSPSGGTPRGGDGSVVELERTPDLCPPRGIVNGAQLEREVYLMIANSAMFNAGEDGLVGVAREMAEDVAGRMGEWRGVGGEVGE